MKDRPLFAQRATEALAAEPIPRYSPDPRSEELIIGAMAARIERDARRRTARRGAMVFAAAATIALASAAAVFGRHHAQVATATPPPAAAPAREAVYAEGNHASVLHLGAYVALNGDVALAEGDRIVASPSGRASIRLPSGTRVAVEPGGQVSFVSQGLMQMFSLDAGSIRADVAKLAEGERFVVRTPDAEVEVRGTSFTVTIGDAAACSGHSTRVDVETGAVVVRSGGKEERVDAGARWPATCGEAPEDVASTPKGGVLGPRRRHVRTPRETSELKAQTLLYGEALVARRSGDAPGAIARFDRYLSLYPESALAEAASVSRMKLLETTDPARAAVAARAYLERYPYGHARDEAARIVASP